MPFPRHCDVQEAVEQEPAVSTSLLQTLEGAEEPSVSASAPAEAGKSPEPPARSPGPSRVLPVAVTEAGKPAAAEAARQSLAVDASLAAEQEVPEVGAAEVAGDELAGAELAQPESLDATAEYLEQRGGGQGGPGPAGPGGGRGRGAAGGRQDAAQGRVTAPSSLAALVPPWLCTIRYRPYQPTPRLQDLSGLEAVTSPRAAAAGAGAGAGVGAEGGARLRQALAMSWHLSCQPGLRPRRSRPAGQALTLGRQEPANGWVAPGVLQVAWWRKVGRRWRSLWKTLGTMGTRRYPALYAIPDQLILRCI